MQSAPSTSGARFVPAVPDNLLMRLLMFLIYLSGCQGERRARWQTPRSFFFASFPKYWQERALSPCFPGEGVSPSPAGERTCGTASGSVPPRLGRAAAGEVIFNQGEGYETLDPALEGGENQLG